MGWPPVPIDSMTALGRPRARRSRDAVRPSPTPFQRLEDRLPVHTLALHEGGAAYTRRSMSLIVVRHGETGFNAARVLQPADTPLSERGLAQARAVAERLAGAGLVAVLSSDMPRALQTALAIVEAVPGLPLHTSALLHERNFGDLRGLPIESLDHDPIVSPEAPPGGESMARFLDRARQAFAEAVALHRRLGGPLAVVSHGLVIRAWLEHQVRLGTDPRRAPRIGNTAVCEIDPRAPHAVGLLNCTAHLVGRCAEDGSSLSGG